MSDPFPQMIRDLPQADIPLPGLTAYLSQAADHQLLFMHFQKSATLPEHAHAAQFGVVLEGQIDLRFQGKTHRFTKGDRYTIPAGVPHSATVYAGYTDISFFDEAQRYSPKGR